MSSTATRVRIFLISRLADCVTSLYRLLIYFRNLLRLYDWRLKFDPRPEDVLIASYPRSGARWVWMIVDQLMADQAVEHHHLLTKTIQLEELSQRPMPEPGGRPPRRLFKTHLPYRKVLKGPGKYVYVFRDGADVAAADYHHSKTFLGYRGAFDEFFSKFLKGSSLYGTWFDHVRGWVANEEDLDVLYLKFESLLEDFEAAIRNIARFCNVELTETALSKIVARCKPELVAKREKEYLPPPPEPQGSHLTGQLIREGKTDSWKQGLNDEQKRAYAAEFRRRLGGLGLEKYLPDQSFHAPSSIKAQV